jgi:transketolase
MLSRSAPPRGFRAAALRGELPAGFRAGRLPQGNWPQRQPRSRPARHRKWRSRSSTARPETLGGSADLTGSNLTQTSQTEPVTPERFKGRYIHYGIREHGMAAAMNGIALHGGLIPLWRHLPGLFRLCAPAMRLASLMGSRPSTC